MTTAPLPRSRPADVQVASTGIDAFLDAVETAPDIELHSLMVLRHGHVLAEGWWAPYRPDGLHLLYSLSKSVTATALGLAVAEGLLDLDDTVVSHLPELAGVATHPWSRSMRLRHLAAMATGHHEDTLDRAVQLDPAEPLRGFLALPPDSEPGSVFAYNNGATYTLGAVLQRVTGQTLTAYLTPRLLEPLGVSASAWHEHPPGRELGFSGLHLTTESIAGSASCTSTTASGQDGGCGRRAGWPRPPGCTSRTRPSPTPTGSRATASSSGAPGTATAGTGRTGSSAWCCPSRTPWW